MKLLLAIAGLVVVAWIVIHSHNKGLLEEPKNKDISNTRWQVAIKNVNDHVLQVGPVSSNNEVTVTRVSGATSNAGSGTYFGGKLIFTLSHGNLNATVTGVVARDGKTMSGTILTNGPAGGTQQEFTAVKL